METVVIRKCGEHIGQLLLGKEPLVVDHMPSLRLGKEVGQHQLALHPFEVRLAVEDHLVSHKEELKCCEGP